MESKAIEVVKLILTFITRDPEAVTVGIAEGINGKQIVVEVADSDKGGCIGSGGETAQAIRHLARVVARRYEEEIIPVNIKGGHIEDR